MTRWHSSSLRFPGWVISWAALLVVGAIYIVSALLSPASSAAPSGRGEKEEIVSAAQNITQEKTGVHKELFLGPRRAQMACSRALLQIDYSDKASGAIVERMEDVHCLAQQELSSDKKEAPYQTIAMWKAATALLDYNTMSCSVTQLEFSHGQAPGHRISAAMAIDASALTDVTSLRAQQADLLLFEQKEVL